jgi:hypothetical protein
VPADPAPQLNASATPAPERPCGNPSSDTQPTVKGPYTALGNPIFSPDGARLAYRARQGERWSVAVDDRTGPLFDRASAPVFSPDGQRIA